MNLKDFLRGLGAGIIFSTLVMLTAYMTTGKYKISDEEIIQRAEKLGMVKQEKLIVDNKNTEAVTTTEATTATEDVIDDTATTTDATNKTEITTEAAIDSQLTKVEVTVTRGMSSEEVAKLLQNAGVIDSAEDFDNYLNTNGYSNSIRVNTFKLNNKMTYEEIAKELTKGED